MIWWPTRGCEARGGNDDENRSRNRAISAGRGRARSHRGSRACDAGSARRTQARAGHPLSWINSPPHPLVLKIKFGARSMSEIKGIPLDAPLYQGDKEHGGSFFNCQAVQAVFTIASNIKRLLPE